MIRTSHGRGLLLVLGMAVFGAVLLVVLPILATNYERSARLHPALGYAYLGLLLIVALALFYLALRLAGNSRRVARDRRPDHTLTPHEQQQRIEEQIARARKDAHDAPEPVRYEIEQALASIDLKMERQVLEVVAFGTISSGKSSVLNALAGAETFAADVRGGTTTSRQDIPWPGDDRVVLVDTPGLGEVGDVRHAELAAAEARNADLVIFVVDGPLKSFEHEVLRALLGLGKRLVLCLNKSDWLTDADRALVLRQLHEQLHGRLRPEDIVAVRARPAARLRTIIGADGSEREEYVEVPADMAPLAERMLAIVAADGHDLLLANLLLRSRGIAREARVQIQARLDERAGEIITRAMWAAGAAAAAIPIPVLDVAGSLAIQVKLVIDLARVYGRPIDLAAARALMAEMLRSGTATLGAAAAAPVMASVASSAIKSIPLAGTIIGGSLQGLIQALITVWIGRSVREYFRVEQPRSEQRLMTIAKRQWAEVTRPAELIRLIQEGPSHLGRHKAEAGQPEQQR